MSAVGAFTVTKENIEDDRALLTRGVIGTGTEVSQTLSENMLCIVHPPTEEYEISAFIRI